MPTTMMTKDRIWSAFASQIGEHLGADDDAGLWQAAIEQITADAEMLCRRYRGKEGIFAQVGSCSHWLSPHNKGSWFSDVRFAWPTGYGGSGFSISGLPEFDWSLFWEWRSDEGWHPAERAAGRRPLILRVALPTRTARHVRAVAHVYWTPGLPTYPQEPYLQGYAFGKLNGQWRFVEWVGHDWHYDVPTLGKGQKPSALKKRFWLRSTTSPMQKRLITISKFLSKYLRHEPEALGLTLEPGGWVLVDDLLAGADRQGFPITKDELAQVIADNDKQRFALDETGTRIRANQGHSTEVDLQLTEAEPPPQLFHGTVSKFLDAIMAEGLKKMNRHDVHLSKDVQTATKVGERRGKPIILVIDSAKMAADGYKFRLSENGVWLTDRVPAKYIRLE